MAAFRSSSRLSPVNKPVITENRKRIKRELFETTLSVACSALEELDTPRSLSMWLLIKYKEWDLVAQGLSISALDYLDSDSFARDYQATKLLTKADFLPTSFDKKKVALGRFESAEQQCLETNRRWRSMYYDGSGLPDPEVDRIISMTRRKIHSILGRFPANRLLSMCKWGPGATTSITNPRTSVYEKYREPLTGSGPCLTQFSALFEQVSLWSSIKKDFVGVCVNNKVVFVPKDAKTLRSIAIEPSFDTWIQLGIGGLLRSRLALHGVNLDSQETNRDLARYGSLTGKVATIDLSMASDTVAKLFVDTMLPADWLLAMKCSRSASWQRGGESGVYEKFSSMGNGYTFELETLLFYATAMSVGEYMSLPWWEITVFGDDITIGVEAVDLLTRTLTFCGFTVGLSKSFWEGPFRESCGEDYYLGDDVRPYFMRSLLRDVHDYMKCHNGFLRKRVKLPRTARKVLNFATKEDRLFGPSTLGDTVFYSPYPRGWFIPASKKWPQYEGYIVRHYVFKPEKTKFQLLEAGLLASLHSNEESPSHGYSTLRQRGTWVTRTVIIPGWDDDYLSRP